VSENPRVFLRPTLLLASIWLVPLALSAGCGGGSAATPDGGMEVAGSGGGGSGNAGSGSAGTTSDPSASVGSFVVALDETGADPVARITGTVSDAPSIPQNGIILEPVTTDGDCKLLKPRAPFCNPGSCGVGAICVADDTCQNQPTLKDVGTVTVTGVKTASGMAPFDLTNVNGHYGFGQALTYPPFAEGDDVSVTTTGGDYAPFSLHAQGIIPLVLADGALTLEKGKPLTLTWTAKGTSSDASIHVKIDISSHGGSRGELDCDAADTGSLTISATLVTQLLNLGFAGYPSIDVIRQAVSSTVIAPGRVRLELSHRITRNLVIPGLISCRLPDEPCPTGKTCQTDLTCK
jgi:hypothetical protein